MDSSSRDVLIHFLCALSIDARQFLYSTPKELLSKQVVLNIQNLDDNYGILYAVLAHIHPLTREDHPSRPQKYIKFMSDLNYDELKFPLKITDVPKLEKMNPDISINELYYENRNKFILYNSPHMNCNIT